MALAPLVRCPRCREALIDPERTDVCSECEHPDPLRRREQRKAEAR